MQYLNDFAIQVIRDHQKKVGYSPCFKTGKSFCAHRGCCWIEICLEEFYVKPLIKFNIVE